MAFEPLMDAARTRVADATALHERTTLVRPVCEGLVNAVRADAAEFRPPKSYAQ
jgi:hypothetical protein